MALQSRPQLLLTRPLAQSQRFLGELQRRFGPLECVIAPLFAPQVLMPPSAPASGAAIFTSETGVMAAMQAGLWAETGQPLRAYCVGQRTARAASAQGFDAISADGDWRDLLALILADRPTGALTFACAVEAQADLEQALQAQGYTLHRRDVYRQIAQPLSRQAKHLLQGARPVILPLFSPRSADAFCRAAPPAASPLLMAALSPAVRAAFTLPCAGLVTADRPNSAALCDAMAPWLENWGPSSCLP